VFCCEVEAVFNTLLYEGEGELMSLLFSFLDSPAPLSSRTAGYFGRVVSNLLLRKTNEAMQYLQANEGMLEKLAKHVDTTSVAEILKRLVGGDEQSSMLFLPQYAQWLADTPLVEMLLAQLSADSSDDAQNNAADILSSIAHTQPSALASKLTGSDSISALFSHALAPSHQLLVPALDVCIALVEPKRFTQTSDEAPYQEAITRAKHEAVEAMVQHLPSLVGLLADTGDKLVVAPAETPYGVLSPPLGRARLKIVDLLAVLFRSGSTGVEPIMMELEAVQLCCRLFSTYPFNNLLHHCVTALLVASLTRCSEAMLHHVFQHCKLLDWITNLQVEVRPTPLPGQEELAASKPSIRAGYMGHVTQLASTLESFSRQPQSSSSSDTGQESPPGGEGAAAAAAASASPASKSYVVQYLEGHSGWHRYVEQQLHYQQELENTSRWACGRPVAAQLAGLDSDGDEFQVSLDPCVFLSVMLQRGVCKEILVMCSCVS
jgi:serine/threonine-protein phosphatase 6 regulatory subunit 3